MKPSSNSHCTTKSRVSLISSTILLLRSRRSTEWWKLTIPALTSSPVQTTAMRYSLRHSGISEEIDRPGKLTSMTASTDTMPSWVSCSLTPNGAPRSSTKWEGGSWRSTTTWERVRASWTSSLSWYQTSYQGQTRIFRVIHPLAIVLSTIVNH